jgi:hypothetical protein
MLRYYKWDGSVITSEARGPPVRTGQARREASQFQILADRVDMVFEKR